MMHPLRKQRLIKMLALMLVLSVVAALILYSVRQNISLFYTPTQIEQGRAPLHQALRVGGMVVRGSVKKSISTQSIEFKITDFSHDLTIRYQGLLPDLFREGQGVVIHGELVDQGHLMAQEVLAKHDEKYMPPELKDMKVVKQPKGSS